jgi:hypothetical protein
VRTRSFLGRSIAVLVAMVASISTGEAFSQPTNAGACDPHTKPDGSCSSFASARKVMKGPPRPTFSEVKDLDYGALPLTEPRKLTRGPEEKFSIRAPFQRSDEKPTVPSEFLILAAPDASLRVRNVALVANQELGIGQRHLTGETEWYVVDDNATSADTALVRRYQGRLVDGMAVAQSAEVVRAVAVLPGKLYAFRRVVAGEETPREELGIVAPHALWTGASDPLTDPNDNVTSPAHVVRTAPMERGSSASLSVVLDEVSGSTAKPLMRRTVVDIDAVWPAEGEPMLTLFVGSASGTREDLAPKDRRRF